MDNHNGLKEKRHDMGITFTDMIQLLRGEEYMFVSNTCIFFCTRTKTGTYVRSTLTKALLDLTIQPMPRLQGILALCCLPSAICHRGVQPTILTQLVLPDQAVRTIAHPHHNDPAMQSSTHCHLLHNIQHTKNMQIRRDLHKVMYSNGSLHSTPCSASRNMT